jgi:hypothetical protein
MFHKSVVLIVTVFPFISSTTEPELRGERDDFVARKSVSIVAPAASYVVQRKDSVTFWKE